MEFKEGQFAQLKIDGAVVMILDNIKYQAEEHKTAIDGYIVRVPSYETIKVAHFELQQRKIDE